MKVFKVPVKRKPGRSALMADELKGKPRLLHPNCFKSVMRTLADVMNNPHSEVWGKLNIDMTKEEIKFIIGFF